MNDVDRTEPATPRRREDARRRGQVAKSHDLASAVVITGTTLAFAAFGAALIGGFVAALKLSLSGLHAVEPAGLVPALGSTAASFAWSALPLIAAIGGAGLLAHMVQTGPLWAMEPLKPQAERLDPAKGLTRLFSARTFVRLFMGLLKAAAIVGVLAWTVWSERHGLLGEGALGPVAARLAFLLGLRLGFVLLVLAAADWLFQKIQHERDLRMSREEIREEMRRFEGDPRLRDRRRALHRRLASQRMVHLVPRATVVVSGPDDAAAALRFEAGRDHTPVLVGKGRGATGRRILEAAHEHGIPVIERPDAAAEFLRRAEAGEAIPESLYQTAADLVAMAMKIRGRSAA